MISHIRVMSPDEYQSLIQRIRPKLQTTEEVLWIGKYIPEKESFKDYVFKVYLLTNVRIMYIDFKQKTSQYINYQNLATFNSVVERTEVFNEKTNEYEPVDQETAQMHFFRKNIESTNLKDINLSFDRMLSSDIPRAKEVLLQQVRKQTEYKIIEEGLEAIAEQYNLTYTPIPDSEKGQAVQAARLDGMINEMLIYVQLKGILPIETFHVEFFCPNYENNSFSISRETLPQKMAKLSGAQDVQVNNQAFDKLFMLQTDNPSFLKTILSTNIQELLNECFDFNMEAILFGDQKNLKRFNINKDRKKRIREDESILDGHLISSKKKGNKENHDSYTNDLNTSRVSKLRYIVNIDEQYPKTKLLEEMNQIMELMARLSNEIKAYYSS